MTSMQRQLLDGHHRRRIAAQLGVDCPERVVQVGKETLPAKPVCYPERGESPRRLSADQYDVMRSSSGLRTAQTITQLTNELKAGMVDVMKHRDGLECLRDTIGDALRMEVSA